MASAQIFHFHNTPGGLPEELSDSQGDIRWQATYSTWGNTQTESWQLTQLSGQPVPHQRATPLPQGHESQIQQNLRFQGQYLDRDTGLHYNTFRFYDPDIGRFISPDPIGLAGGVNLHSYAPNPISWIDPWGLSCGGTQESQRRTQTPGDVTLPTARAARRAAMRDQNIPTSRSTTSVLKPDGVDASGGKMMIEEIRIGGRNTGGGTTIGEIKVHPDGHKFPATSKTPYPTHELPHYHGGKGQHISYESGTPRSTSRYGR